MTSGEFKFAMQVEMVLNKDITKYIGLLLDDIGRVQVCHAGRDGVELGYY